MQVEFKMPKWHHKNKKERKCLLKLTKNERTNKIILSVQKMFVLLQTEINRGTVLLDVQNLVMTFRASQPVDFFFLCLYRCDTVLYLLARTFSLSQMTKGNSFTLAWRENVG